MSENKFRRDPSTHQLVACKDNQIPLCHNGLDVEYLIELVPENDGQVVVHYYFDPEATHITQEHKDQIVEDTKAMLNDFFSDPDGWNAPAGITRGDD